MQNAQNATEIQQRVINLVELYRTKVGKESQIAEYAKDNHHLWGGADNPEQFSEGPHIEVWKKHLMVNEQLLGHFYELVAGKNAEKEVLDQLQSEVYDRTIFTNEEELFLTTNFKDMVNYIILTPCDDSLEWVFLNDDRDAYTIPKEVLELVKARVEIPVGSRVYYPQTAFAQLANLFNGCKYYCDTMFNAWTKVAIYANNIDAEDNAKPSSYDAIVSYLPIDDDDSKAIARLCDAYRNLAVGGKLVLICSSDVLACKNKSIRKERETDSASADVNARFRRMLLEDKAIIEIIQLPQVMSGMASCETYCLLIAEKGRTESDVLLIDARVASDNMDAKHYAFSFNNAKFNAIMQNEGVDPNTGLRKVVKVSSEELSPEILIPQVYVIERPSDAEHPVPLSSLCSLASTKVRDVQFNLPEDTLWITESDLTSLYTGDLDMSGIRKADCPNNPPYVEGSKEYGFDKDGKFDDSLLSQIHMSKGFHVLLYRGCTYLDGNNDVVLYARSQEKLSALYEHPKNDWVQVSVVRATERPYAVDSGILVFRLKDDYDANSLAALLRLPIVYRQLIAYQEYGLDNHLDDIIVPTDKRIIYEERLRMKNEMSVAKDLDDKIQTMKTEYINEVRMRKHDIRPHLRQLASSERLMLHYIDNASDMEELKRNLRNQIEHGYVALTSISMIVDHLSDEEKFGSPELLNIDRLLTDIEVNHDEGEGFVIEYDCNEESFRKYGFAIPNILEQLQLAQKQGVGMVEFLKDNLNENLPLFVSIAPIDFQRMVNNIIENARKHGFTDHARTDYYMSIDLSINKERNMYQIDFCNNGTPLPEGMTKTRYGLKGEKAGSNAGTGSGGYIVKSIVNHYGGDYDIFCKDGITTVRILLPIATI